MNTATASDDQITRERSNKKTRKIEEGGRSRSKSGRIRDNREKMGEKEKQSARPGPFLASRTRGQKFQQPHDGSF